MAQNPASKLQPSAFQRQEKHKPKPSYQTVFNQTKYNTNSAQYIPTKIYESYREQNSSQMSKGSRQSNNIFPEQINGYQKISQLTQRLKNIHHFYRIRIDQQKNKNTQRNQVFMNIIQELQKTHNQKIQILKQEIKNTEQQKKQVNYVDDKMSEIKMSIDDILKQSSMYKVGNQKLEKEIMSKEETIREKQKELEKLQKQCVEYRNQLESIGRVNMKENKVQKQMLDMIKSLQRNAEINVHVNGINLDQVKGKR